MNDNDNKCAHEMCDCMVNDDADYCSDHCEKADDQDITEIKCDCGHSACS
jgi:hypothetical protein